MTDPSYKWVALANTTAAVFMASLDGSIVIIALPAIFRGIHLDPLSAGNIGYLLWMIMGYRLVQAVLVVNLGRLGDMFGRVRMYNQGFVVFTVASILLSFDPFQGAHGAMWLIGWRFVQAIGGSMLMANSAAILTDVFPAERRGFALGINQVSVLAGMFIGLVLGGILVEWDWRAVFWINVPVGVFGTLWAYLRLRDNGERHRARIDWWGNITFAVGLGAVLIACTYGIQPYHGNSMGWESPVVLGELIGGIALLIVFVLIETRVAEPMFRIGLLRIRRFTCGILAGLLASIARGGIQFLLIIWLQGIWLPLHGYSYQQTPLWAGIFLLPMTAGFLVSGPASGILSDKFGSRGIATAGMAVFTLSFVGLMLLPVNFPYMAFAIMVALNGIGSGMFASPNSSSIMGSVPARERGAASGMRSTFRNSGIAMSIGVVFTLMIAGLSNSLPATLNSGLIRLRVPPGVAHELASLPPVSALFASVLGVNPIRHLLRPAVLSALPASSRAALTGESFFPRLLTGPFHGGLIVVFSVSAGLSVLAGMASLLRGRTSPGYATPAGAPRLGVVTITTPPYREAGVCYVSPVDTRGDSTGWNSVNIGTREEVSPKPVSGSVQPEKLLLRALAGERTERPPIWLMRQAGRYLPEYHRVREAAGGMVGLCNSPEHAVEVTLQPIRRFGLDAAILFADLPQVAAALGQTLDYRAGEGPVLTPPVRSAADIADFLSVSRLHEELAPVYETVRRLTRVLPAETALIGYAGAPWTIATYMVEGRGGGTSEHSVVKQWALSDPDGFQPLIDLLTTAIIQFLCRQIEAGAEAVQLFDTWAGILPDAFFQRWCVNPVATIIAALKTQHPDVPVIAFPRGAGLAYDGFAEATGADCIGLDATVPLEWAARKLQRGLARCVQGNLDPQLLVAGGPALHAETERILRALSGGPFVFNLGHGIVKTTPPEHVTALAGQVRAWTTPAPPDRLE